MDNERGTRMEVLKPAWLNGENCTRSGISHGARWLTLTHIVRRDLWRKHRIDALPTGLRAQTPTDDEPAVWLVMWESVSGGIENVFLVPAGNMASHYVGRFQAGGNYAALSLARHELYLISPNIGYAFRIHDRLEAAD